MDVIAPSQLLERSRKQRISRAVIERDVRRRTQHHEDPCRVDSERARDVGVGLEIGEVVLLFEAGVAGELRRPEPVAPETLRRDGFGYDDARRGSGAELVLRERELVVERRRGWNAEAPRRQRQVMRAVCEPRIERPFTRPPAQLPEAACHCLSLSRSRPASVRADDRRVDAVQFEQLLGLCERTGRHLDLVPVLLEKSDQRAKEGHVRGVRDVDPDAHRRRLYSETGHVPVPGTGGAHGISDAYGYEAAEGVLRRG